MKRPAYWLSVAAFLGSLVLYFFCQVRPLLNDAGTGVTGLTSHANDYKHIYLGSQLLANGITPYNDEIMRSFAGEHSQIEDPRFRTILPYVYLPFTGFVMRPLTMLPFAKSVVVFQMVNHLCIVGGLLLAAWSAGLWKPRWEFWVSAIVFTVAGLNAAVYRQNNAGQLNAVLLFGYALLFTAIARRWHNSAIGFIAAFLMLFKLSPGIFLFWFLFRREWQRAAWMMGWAMALTLLTVLVYGMEVHTQFLPVLADMGYGKSTWGHLGHTFWRDPYNQSINALFHRLLVQRDGGGIEAWLSLAPGVANALTWVVSLGIFGVFGWGSFRKKDSPRHLAGSFSLAVCASLLLPSIMWDHYLTQALLAAVLLGGALVGVEGWQKWLLWGGVLGAVIVMALPVALDQEAFRSGAGLILMSMKLTSALLLFGVAVAVMTRHGSWSADTDSTCGGK